MTDYKIAVSCGKGMGIIENKVKSWADIVKKLTHHVEVAQKENAGFFVGGAFSGEHRVDEDLICRSLLTLDIDKYVGTIDDLEFDRRWGGHLLPPGCADGRYGVFPVPSHRHLQAGYPDYRGGAR